MSAAVTVASNQRRLVIAAGQVLIGVALLGLWDLADLSGRYGIWIGSPVRTAVQLWDWLSTGFVFPHLWETLEILVLGYAVGAIAGVGLGLALGLSARQGRAWDPFVRGFEAIPRFALAPLFIVWLGTGLESKLVLIATAVGYIFLSTTVDGVRQVDADLVAAIRQMGASRAQIVRHVVLPSTYSAILLGARVAIPYGLVSAIAADMLMGSQGLGYLLSRASGLLEMDQLFAAIVVVLGLGVLLNALLGSRTRGLATSGDVAGKTW